MFGLQNFTVAGSNEHAEKKNVEYFYNQKVFSFYVRLEAQVKVACALTSCLSYNVDSCSGQFIMPTLNVQIYGERMQENI